MSKNNLQLNIENETSALKSVILGIGEDSGPFYPNNPKMKYHITNGTMPKQKDMISEIKGFRQILENYGIKVIIPRNIPGQDQMFSRDIAFVIGNKIVKANMKIDNRRLEYEGIKHIIGQINPDNVLIPPKEAFIEGGDVVLYNKYIFVGQGNRTNYAGYKFLKNSFPEKEVIPLNLKVTLDHLTNVLHLDCVFQPVGHNHAILYEDGFLEKPKAIIDIFREKNIIKISAKEKFDMFPNIFSISPKLVVIEKNFHRLNEELNKIGIKTIPVKYSEMEKNDGLLRCSTLPLYREKT